MDLKDILRRLEAAQGDASALALATIDFVLSTQSPALVPVVEAAAVPHWFDERILRELLDADVPGGTRWFDQLKDLTVVEAFQAHAGWNVHEVTRLALRQRLAADQPDRFRTLSARAATVISGPASSEGIERVYHQLVSNPEAGVSSLRALWKGWLRSGQIQHLQALGKSLEELCAARLLGTRAEAYATVALMVIGQDRLAVKAQDELARKAVDLMTPTGDDLGMADVYGWYARILRSQGRLNDAVAAIHTARTHLNAWASASAPDDLGLADEQASLHETMGRVLSDHGQLQQALEEFEAALSVRQRLCESEPSSDLRRRELAVAQADVGDALLPTSRQAEAESYFATALRALEQPIDSNVGRETNEQNAAQLHARLADVLGSQGKDVAALAQYERAEHILVRLTHGDPDHRVWKEMLADVHLRSGLTYAVREDYEAAESRMAAAREIYQRLAESDPGNPGLKVGLGTMCSSFGFLREQQGRVVDAAHEYVEAERLLGELSQTDPDAVAWKFAHITAQNVAARLMQQYAAQFEQDEDKLDMVMRAMVLLQRAIASNQQIVERDPSNVTYQSSLAWTQRLVARALETLTDIMDGGVKVEIESSAAELRDVALAHNLQSASTLKTLATQAPTNTEFRREFVLAITNAGRVLEKLQRDQGALLAYREGLPMAEMLAALDGTNKLWTGDLESLRQSIARVEGRIAGDNSGAC